jgi:hypothetical protein
MADDSISRGALERVLARASELQASAPGDASDAISESRLLEIAQEVGLDVNHVRQAIAEERAQLPMTVAERGPMLDALGEVFVGAQRVVPGTPGELLQRLEAVLPRGELLLPVRRTGDRLILEPRRDPLGNVFRAMGVGGRRFDLVRVDSVVVSAMPVDATRSVLRFDAVLTGARSLERTTVLITSALLWLIVVAIAVPMLVFSLVLPTFAAVTVGLLSVIAAGGSWLTWRGIKARYRAMLGRVQMRLDALLDEAEAGRLTPPASLLDRLLTAADTHLTKR